MWVGGGRVGQEGRGKGRGRAGRAGQGRRGHGRAGQGSMDPTGYLWFKYVCFMISGCKDIDF